MIDVKKRNNTFKNLAALDDFQGNLKQTMFTKVVPIEAKKMLKIKTKN